MEFARVEVRMGMMDIVTADSNSSTLAIEADRS